VGGQKIFLARSGRKIDPPPLSKPWRRPCCWLISAVDMIPLSKEQSLLNISAFSGVFTISIKGGATRARRREAEVWRKELGYISRKKSFLSSKISSLQLTPFLTGRKHGQSLKALGYEFYGSITKRSLQKQCKNYPKINGLAKGVVAPLPPPPLNMPRPLINMSRVATRKPTIFTLALTIYTSLN